jgi:hypothetical protein
MALTRCRRLSSPYLLIAADGNLLPQIFVEPRSRIGVSPRWKVDGGWLPSATESVFAVTYFVTPWWQIATRGN